jgi:hypothetical protein
LAWQQEHLPKFQKCCAMSAKVADAPDVSSLRAAGEPEPPLIPPDKLDTDASCETDKLDTAATGDTNAYMSVDALETGAATGGTDTYQSGQSVGSRPSQQIFEFADQEAIKQKVRASMMKAEPYNVFNVYHQDGLYSLVAMHPVFENATLGVIAFNAVWMAIDTDWNTSTNLLEAHPIFQIMEQLFCIYFSFELFVRFMAFREKCTGVNGSRIPPWTKDAWFMFDSLLVTMMVMETWVFTLIEVMGGGSGSPLKGQGAILRLFRLLRLSRLMRMLRSLPELMVLVKGMATAMKSVIYVMFLLIICLYVFAIAITQLAIGNPIQDLYFGTVQESMYSLLIYGTFLDNLSQFCDDIRADSYVILVLVGAFVGVACMCVLNMLIGVLCEVISKVSQDEKEENRHIMVSEKMSEVLCGLDKDVDGKISQQEFQAILNERKILEALQEVEVDPVTLVDFADMFFINDGEPIELSFESFMDMVMSLRGSNNATVKDVMNLWKQMSPKLGAISNDVAELDEKVDSVETEMEAIVSIDDGIREKVAQILAELDKSQVAS